jgi:hypothetical protein
VSYGASVCVGCKAEVRYGNTLGALGAAFIGAVVAGYVVQWILPASLGVFSLLTFIVVLFWLGAVLLKNTSTQVNFSRRYRR